MKKGSFNLAMEMPLWFLRIGMLIIILIVITAGVSIVLSREVDYKDFESKLILYNIYNCLSYDNHFGVIDPLKLKDLEKCLDFRNLEIKLSFFDLDNKLITESYVDKEGFSAEWKLCNIKFENEKLNCYTSRDYVLYKDSPLIMEFNIINKEDTIFISIAELKGKFSGGGAGRSY